MTEKELVHRVLDFPLDKIAQEARNNGYTAITSVRDMLPMGLS